MLKLNNWWNEIAQSRNPDFIICGEDGTPYMNRWWIVPRNEGANVYLHQILKDDDERALHDHPWDSFSTVLEGTLREYTPNHPEGRVLRAGETVQRLAKDAHRLEVIEPAFTLFSTGPRIREWGFHCPNGWVHWQDFTKAESPGEVGRGCGE